jgi:aspartate kinase
LELENFIVCFKIYKVHLEVKKRVGKVIIRNLRDKPGVAADVFNELSKKGIEVLSISFDTAIKGKADLAFITYESQLEDARSYLYALLYDEDNVEIQVDEKVVLLIFKGIEGNTQLIADAFNLIASSGTNIEMISASPNEVYVLIREFMLDNVIDMFKIIYPKSEVEEL